MRVSIIGCGWLGLPLGEYLAFKGYKIRGSITRVSKIIELEKAGIEPFLLSLSPEIDCENFDELVDSEVIIINIPPRVAKNGAEFHYKQMENLIAGIKAKFSVNSVPQGDILPKIIFISSTSVYPDNCQTVTEESSVDENHILIKVENLLKNTFEKITILRAGGLMGYDRFPAKYYAGKPLENWASGVNYIHRDDAILLIYNIIENNIWNETFNVCSPIHPSRKEIIEKNCMDLNLDLPIFIEPELPIPYKIISPEKLISETNYQFKYPNPLDFFYQK
ncbi:MAG: SDR family NAD(P)-dependent oxidoreductase [Bacteroidota bacterium]